MSQPSGSRPRVVVEIDDQCVPGRGESGVAGVAESGPRLGDHSDQAGVAPGQLGAHRGGVIGGRVVDEDDLAAQPVRQDRRHSGPQLMGAVVRADHNGGRRPGHAAHVGISGHREGTAPSRPASELGLELPLLGRKLAGELQPGLAPRRQAVERERLGRSASVLWDELPGRAECPAARDLVDAGSGQDSAAVERRQEWRDQAGTRMGQRVEHDHGVRPGGPHRALEGAPPAQRMIGDDHSRTGAGSLKRGQRHRVRRVAGHHHLDVVAGDRLSERPSWAPARAASSGDRTTTAGRRRRRFRP